MISLRRIPAALAAAAVALTATAGAQAPSPGATIDRASQAFQRASTVRATFEQTLTNPLTGSTSKASGELALAQPNKAAIRFAKPAGDLVVADGKWLWVYLPSSAPGQVLKMPAKSRTPVGFDAVGDLLTSPRSKYDVADGGASTLGGRATHAVLLTPKQDGQGIAKAQVWVDDADASIRQISLTDANGLVRLMRMTTWTTNASLPASTFKFAMPAGAKVVDQAKMF
jgi:outer membrane lipoprotein carrier protein